MALVGCVVKLVMCNGNSAAYVYFGIIVNVRVDNLVRVCLMSSGFCRYFFSSGFVMSFFLLLLSW